jgi:hypothetical protein
LGGLQFGLRNGVFLFANEGTVGASPLLRIPPGRYRLLTASEFYQDDVRIIDWPPDPLAIPTIELRPASTYHFPDLTIQTNQLTLLRGNLYEEGGDRKPIKGATATIVVPKNTWPFASCMTDENGGWVFAIPLGRAAAPFNATIHFDAPDGNGFDIQPVPVTPGGETSVRQTALRGSVLTTRDVPIPNAAVTVSGIPGASITRSSGEWSFYMRLNQQSAAVAVTATAPGGRSQTQNVQVENGVTLTVPAFRIAT